MTFENLAKMVADDFQEDMIENGFESFDEMRRCYDWEWSDVKNEVDFTISEIARKEHLALWMSDDQTFIQLGFDDIDWRSFKKMFLNNLRTKEVKK